MIKDDLAQYKHIWSLCFCSIRNINRFRLILFCNLRRRYTLAQSSTTVCTVSCVSVSFMMGTVISGEQWTCKKCTLDNSRFAKVCQACGSPCPWSCDCGTKNLESLVSCSACGSQRPSTSLMSKILTPRPKELCNPESEWSCPKCTLNNSAKRKACSACGCEKPKCEHPMVVDVEANETVSASPPRLYPDLEISKVEVNLDIAEHSPEGLKCPRCNAQLCDNASVTCTNCGARCSSEGFKPRPFPSSSLPSTPQAVEAPPPGTWNCPACTFNNKGRNLLCLMCGDASGALLSLDVSDEPKEPTTDGELLLFII